MRIYFVNRFFYPDISATSQMLSDLAFRLAERGHDVSVITTRLRYEGGADLAPRETVNGVDVIRLRTFSFGRSSALGRLADYLSFYIAVLIAIMRHVKRGDLVVAKTDPPMLAIVTHPFARLKGAHHVNWLQDIFPEVMIGLGIASSWPMRRLVGMIKPVRNVTIRRADANVVIGRRMADQVRKMGADPAGIHIVQNWADGALIKPVPHNTNPLRAEWCFANDFVIGYSGNLGRAHDITTLVEAMTRIQERCRCVPQARRVRWLFVGGGHLVSRLKSEVASSGIADVTFQPYQPREMLAQSLSVADVHLVSLRPGVEGFIVPSKYYGIAAAGRATVFIGAADGEIALLLAVAGSGITIAEGDGAGLADTLLALARDPARVAELGRRARAAFDAEYDLDYAVMAWERVIASLPQR